MLSQQPNQLCSVKSIQFFRLFLRRSISKKPSRCIDRSVDSVLSFINANAITVIGAYEIEIFGIPRDNCFDFSTQHYF